MLVAMVLLSMAFVPAVSAATEKPSEQQMPEEVKHWIEENTINESMKLWRQNQTEQWMQKHSVNVTSTTIYRYEKGYLEIKEIYIGKDLENKVGINEFTKVRKIPVDATTVETISVDGETFSLEEGNEIVLVTEITVIITSETDPFPWWNYGYEYPQWTWSEDSGSYDREDPINLAWECTDRSTVKSRILDQDWTDVFYPFEEKQYVSDPQNGWMLADGVADDLEREWGGYHARLWEMSNGDVVANAHHDTRIPHRADEYEPAEDLVGGFFDNDLTNWWVLYDNCELDNYVASPLNDGDATCIYGVGS